jgi:hypothetical protein
MDFLRQHVRVGVLSFGMLLILGSALFAVRNGEFCIACQSFGMMAGWLAFWDKLTSIGCTVGVAVDKLKQMSGEPAEADRVLDDDEYYIPPPPSSESLPSFPADRPC